MTHLMEFAKARSARLQAERIARRVQALRVRRKMTQDQLAEALGFPDRQTVAAIEAGTRRLQPEELARIATILEVEAQLLLDPYRLVDEAEFSFRTCGNVDPAELAAFEDMAGRWIATYRELSRRAEEAPQLFHQKLSLSEFSSFEDACDAGERLWEEWALGDTPAARLEKAIESELGVLVLYVDAPPAISGAASHLPELQTILVNRRESVGRRSYDLAHELFHVLTWDAMPPARVESTLVRRVKGNRVEKLADNFAAALLMPTQVIDKYLRSLKEDQWVDWMRTTAKRLRVSFHALSYRVANLGHLTVEAAKAFIQQFNSLGARPDDSAELPRLFSARFIQRIYDAVESGYLSVRRASTLLLISPADFAVVCESYALALSYTTEPA